MSLKFTFGGGSPDHHDHGSAPAGVAELPLTPAPVGGGSLEFALTLEDARISGEARSESGVAYATAGKAVTGQGAAAAAGAIRSVLSRLEAELVEPLRTTATSIELVLDADARARLGVDAAALLAELGADPAAPAVDDALQARTGITAGTPIRIVAD
jgi:hypothetical protein